MHLLKVLCRSWRSWYILCFIINRIYITDDIGTVGSTKFKLNSIKKYSIILYCTMISPVPDLKNLYDYTSFLKLNNIPKYKNSIPASSAVLKKWRIMFFPFKHKEFQYYIIVVSLYSACTAKAATTACCEVAKIATPKQPMFG